MADLDQSVKKAFAWAMSPSAAANPDWSRLTESYRTVVDYTPTVAITSNRVIDGPLGPGSLPIRIYTPPHVTGPRPLLIWVHGGGFAAGGLNDLETDAVARELCRRGDLVVVAVDYHLTGYGVGYPTLHREVGAAITWARIEATNLGTHPEAISVGGASAGANLAIMAALEASESGSDAIKNIVLIYPALYRLLQPWRERMPDMSNVPAVMRFDEASYAVMMNSYIGSGAPDAGKYASVDGHDLRVLPRTLVVTSEYDDLRPSGDRFAVDLLGAGVPVQRYLAEGVPHGHLAMPPGVVETSRTLDEIARFLT